MAKLSKNEVLIRRMKNHLHAFQRCSLKLDSTVFFAVEDRLSEVGYPGAFEYVEGVEIAFDNILNAYFGILDIQKTNDELEP